MDTELNDYRSEGPPRKRLLTNSNPKQSIVTASPESTVSSNSSSDRFVKKTRELPNLSDCHSCAVRINYTNPRERLQPMDSMWRIVLLCKKCSKGVKSSALCPYCFSAVADENDCFKCRDCQHSIHKDCVKKYSSGFSVCIDCWVPDAIANSIRTRNRKSRRKNVESCEHDQEQADTLLESRVSVVETNRPNSVREEVRIKVASAAAKARENALIKAVVVKNDVGSCEGETKVADDVEFAFMLHRAINSSPMTSTYACLMSSLRGDDAKLACYSRRRARKKIIMVNSSSLDVPLICYSRRRRKCVFRNSSSLNTPLVCYSRKRSSKKSSHDRECECLICVLSKRIDKHASLSSVCLKASNCGSYSENSLNGYECKENAGRRINKKPHRFLLKYYRTGKCKPRPSVFVKDPDCGSFLDSANFNAKDVSDTKVFGNGDGCLELCENRNSNRFLLKYKRSSRSKLEISCKVEEISQLLPLNHPSESTTLSDS